MALSLILSFVGEGPTDERFFPNIAERVVEQFLLERNIQATIQWQQIQKEEGNSVDRIRTAAIQAKHCSILIIHCDADDINNLRAYNERIKPGLDALSSVKDEICKNIIEVIPIAETEAWMLVDKELLKEEMNTSLSDINLGLTYKVNSIENIRDPKKKLLNAINLHHENIPPKRKRSAVTISELYEPISRKIDLKKLDVLNSYKSFKNKIIQTLESNVLI